MAPALGRLASCDMKSASPRHTPVLFTRKPPGPCRCAGGDVRSALHFLSLQERPSAHPPPNPRLRPILNSTSGGEVQNGAQLAPGGASAHRHLGVSCRPVRDAGSGQWSGVGG